jgi:hypothetical protein
MAARIRLGGQLARRAGVAPKAIAGASPAAEPASPLRAARAGQPRLLRSVHAHRREFAARIISSSVSVPQRASNSATATHGPNTPEAASDETEAARAAGLPPGTIGCEALVLPGMPPEARRRGEAERRRQRGHRGGHAVVLHAPHRGRARNERHDQQQHVRPHHARVARPDAAQRVAVPEPDDGHDQ